MVLAETLRSLDAVELGHPDIHDDQIGAQLRRERHRGFAIARLTHHIEAVVPKDLDDVHADERLILGDDDASGC